MGTIIIGIIIAIIICIILLLSKKVKKTTYVLPVLIVIFSIFFSMVCAEKYEDWEIVEEKAIAAMQSTSGNTVYAIYEDGKYIYRYRVETDFWSEKASEYVVDTVKCNVIEDINCDIPQIIKYESKPETTNWFLGTLVSVRTKYVLYVPKGMVEY